MINNSDIKSHLNNFRVKCRTISRFDPNFAGNATKEYQLEYEGNTYRVCGFEKVIIVEVGIDSSVAFAVNIPDKVCLLNQPSGKVSDKTLYTGDYNTEKSHECAHLISPLIQRLYLDSGEGVIICKNGIQLAINSPGKIVGSIHILEDMKRTVETNYPAEEVQKIDVSQIPDELRSLIPFIEKWAISDDDERIVKIESSSARELDQLTKAVTLKIAQINNYLDSFGDCPLTYEALQIGRLAELAEEISLNNK